MKVLLLINRHARKGQKSLEKSVEIFQNLGVEVINKSTEKPKYWPQIIHNYYQEVDSIVVGGGDGTLNKILPALLEAKLPLGILPLGTANDLARTLNIPLSLPEACRTIATGNIKYIDLGNVNDQYFFNVASIGLSVDITQKLDHHVKKRWGILAYGVTALKVIWQARPFRAKIHAHGEIISVKTIQIAVGNGRYYGGGIPVAHDAAIDDQRLDLYSLEMKHWWEIIQLLPAMYRGDHAKLNGVRSLCGETIEIHTRKPRAVNTDGEITTMTPAKFRVIPQILPVIVPNTLPST